VLAANVALGRWERRIAQQFAEDLILTGFSGDGQRTPIGRAVAHRIARLEGARHRRQLATDLRWRVRLAEGYANSFLWPGLVRAHMYPPLSLVQRRVMCEEAALMAAIADHVQHHPGDPRALVNLHRLLSQPPAPDAGRDPRLAAEELRRQLHALSAMLPEHLDPAHEAAYVHRPLSRRR
jgi:hypothetical protein